MKPMALRKREMAVAKLEREMQDRMTCIDEKMALREVTDVYAKYICMMHGWRDSIGWLVVYHKNREKFMQIDERFDKNYMRL